MTTLATKVSDPAERAAVISALRVKGDRYGHAGIAGLAHELAIRLDGDKFETNAQKTLSESTGYDKGTVSRIAKIIRTDKAARLAAVKIKVELIESTDTTFAAAVKVGEMFKRQPAGKGAGADRKATEVDVLAGVHEWLMSADDEQYEARKALVANLLATIDDQRATAAAEAANEEAA